jgi:TRAP-type C4-dicarboxylate transport system substrate-binding protein
MKMLVDKVAQQGKGEIRIKWLGGPEVMPPPAQIEAVRTGRVDMVIHSPNWFMDKVPEVVCLTLSERTPMEERQNGAHDWAAKYLKEKLNVHYLGRAHSASGFWLHTNFPVEKTGDFAGKQIAARRTCVPFFKAMGAVPVDVGKGDWYSAVERGLVDAYSIPVTSVVGWGLLKITKYTIDQEFYLASNIHFFVNLDKWNTLSEKHQRLLDRIAKELEPEIVDYNRKKTAGAVMKMKKAGIKFIKLSPEENKKFLDFAYGALWEDYKKLVGPEVYTKARQLMRR